MIPLADRVLVKTDPIVTQTETGIIILDKFAEKPLSGVVIAVGKGKKQWEMTTKIGDKVLYNKNVGMRVDIDNEDYIIMREVDIFAVIA